MCAVPSSSNLDLSPPGVVSPAEGQDIPQINSNVKELFQYTKNLDAQAASSEEPLQTTVATHSITHGSPIVPWTIGFANLLSATIHNWKDPSFDRVSNVVTLAFMVAAAAATVFVYCLNHQQAAKSEQTAKKNDRVQKIHAVAKFLHKCTKLGIQILNPNQQGQVPFSFKTLKEYKQKLQIPLPQDLKSSITEVKKLYQENPNHEQIPAVVQGKIFPLANHYAKELKEELKKLGHTPPAAAPAAGAEDPNAVVIDH